MAANYDKLWAILKERKMLTRDVDFAEIQDIFLKLLPENAIILDIGCGSGRDIKYFLDRGYYVDGSLEMCKVARKYTGIDVKHMYFHELNDIEKYDGIWACASVLHVEKDSLPDIIHRMSAATKRMELSIFRSSMAIMKAKEMVDILRI